MGEESEWEGEIMRTTRAHMYEGEEQWRGYIAPSRP
jgi:hypothetical protein